MKIFIDNIRIKAKHGVTEQERTVGADFLVSVDAETDKDLATQTDKLTDTVNYAEMADVVRQEMSIPSQLLEHAAGRIARQLLNHFPTLTCICVRLTKLTPPITGLDCNGAGVEVKITK